MSSSISLMNQRSPQDELQDLADSHLLRELRCSEPITAARPTSFSSSDNSNEGLIRREGKEFINFSSNDYLGLSNSTVLKKAVQESIEEHGYGAGASRLISGTQPAHLALESHLAKLKGSEAALSFSSGYATAIGVLGALLNEKDIVILDKLCHASLVDGARLSQAEIRVYPNCHTNRLEELCQISSEKLATKKQNGRLLIVTESLFSMDGNAAPLQEIVQIKERYNALLLVDEAHSFGIMGLKGAGMLSALGIQNQVDLQMGTFSKAVGASGGYIAANKSLIDLIINKARSFIYSTAPPPFLAATIEKSLELIASSEGDQLRKALSTNIASLKELLNLEPLDSKLYSPIIPIPVGGEKEALRKSERLKEKGLLVPAIRYPTVGKGKARLRVSLSSLHKAAQIEKLATELSQ